jgi:hypothetical protein
MFYTVKALSANRKMKYDIEMQNLQTLSQKLASKMPELADYACNIFADKLAKIDLYLALNDNLDADFTKKLLALRQQFKIVGRATYIQRADVLTNLGLAVGRTGTRDPIKGTQ